MTAVNQQEHSVYTKTSSYASTALNQEHSETAAHLHHLAGSGWALWRCVGLRGAGFPASRVLKLSAPECAAVTDRLLSLEESAEALHEHALNLVRNALDELRTGNRWETTEERKPLVKALRELNKGRVPGSVGWPSTSAASFDELRTANFRLEEASAEYERQYLASAKAMSKAIQDVVRDERFCEAVIWQNRQAYHTAIASLLQDTALQARGTKQRQHEELAANYLQRYSVKNDTIGFFGPVGWASLVSGSPALYVKPGPTLLAKRQVYFEAWCIEALAARIGEDKTLRRWLAPRRVPYLYLEGNTLLLPFARPQQIAAVHAALLRACDGERTAAQIVEDLLQRRDLPGMTTAAQLYQQLEELCRSGLVLWDLEVSIEPHAERRLRELLMRIEEPNLRQDALAQVAELDSYRQTVAEAAGDPQRLDRALARLEEKFTAMTGRQPNHSAGKIYVGRTLVYEDCRRDIKVEVGPALLEELVPALKLLLTSARWFTHEVARYYRELFNTTYQELAARTGSRTIDAAAFWQAVQPKVMEQGYNSVQFVPDTFQERWGEVLEISDGERWIKFRSEDLRERVERLFAAPRAGWQFARYQSPDVMIAAESPEAIRRGDYLFVLGEFHVGTNTLRGSLFVEQHPNPADLFNNVNCDINIPRVAPIVPKHWDGVSTRTQPMLVSPKDYRLLATHDSYGVTAGQPLPIGSLVVEDMGDGAMARTRDGRLRLDLIEVFADVLVEKAINYFKMFPRRRYTPRLSIDKLVIMRETWGFIAEEANFADEKQPEERFLAVRRWMRRHQMPRFVFVKVPVERKPFYLDFDSPIYVEMFTRAVRRSREMNVETSENWITVSEMMPRHDQVWLPDAEGHRYTSEFRIVAVDQVTWQGPNGEV